MYIQTVPSEKEPWVYHFWVHIAWHFVLNMISTQTITANEPNWEGGTQKKVHFY